MAAAAAACRRLLCRHPLPSSPSSPSTCRPILLAALSRSSTLSGAGADPPESQSPDPGAASGTEEPSPALPSSDDPRPPTRHPFNRPLENGLEQGIYKAILVGKAGQRPVQKQLRSGRTVVLFSLATGGTRNYRGPGDEKEGSPEQWHRVSVYAGGLGALALKHVKPGSTLYIEGNMESKVFNDPTTGLPRRIREVAVRRDGRLVFIDDGSDAGWTAEKSIKNVGHY